MDLDLRHRLVAAVLVAVLLASVSDQGTRAPIPDGRAVPGGSAAPRSAASVIIGWPEDSRALAGALLEKYGTPNELVSSQLAWDARGPWRRIVVFRDPAAAGRRDHLLETVGYGPVTLARWRELSAFGRGAAYDPVTKELSARTDAEETNFLAVNLADEVVQGRRSAAAARSFYDATVDLSRSGKSSPYMDRLLFTPRRGTPP